jgi:hypothetical protein
MPARAAECIVHDHRAAARLFRRMRIVDQQAAVPVPRSGLEQPERELVSLTD